MVFKSWSDAENPYVTFKDKFLGFQQQLQQANSYSECDSILKDTSEMSVMDVIQALFANAQTIEDLAISKTALDAHLTGSQPDQVFSYIVNSYWCLYHKLRSWGNSTELGVA
jgi:ferritin-like metal-binding protein YciE